MNKVVKCKNDKCEQKFMHTGKDAKCPFCYTEYGEEGEKTVEEKESTQLHKKSFKVWKDR